MKCLNCNRQYIFKGLDIMYNKVFYLYGCPKCGKIVEKQSTIDVTMKNKNYGREYRKTV